MQAVQTKHKKEAEWAVCLECNHEITKSLFWPLASSVWLHSDGTGHKRFQFWKWA